MGTKGRIDDPAQEAQERTEMVVAQRTTITQQLDLPVAPAKMEITLTLADMRNLATTEFKERLLEARAKAEKVKAEAERIVAGLEQKLETAAGELVENSVPPQLIELVAAINAWTGKDQKDRIYKVKLDAPTIELETGIVKGYWKVGKPKISYTEYNLDIDELMKPFELVFDSNMNELAVKLEQAKNQLKEANSQLNAVYRAVSEVPRYGDHIQSELTKAHITGTITKASDILPLIMAVMEKTKLIPPQVRALIEQKG